MRGFLKEHERDEHKLKLAHTCYSSSKPRSNGGHDLLLHNSQGDYKKVSAQKQDTNNFLH